MLFEKKRIGVVHTSRVLPRGSGRYEEHEERALSAKIIKSYGKEVQTGNLYLPTFSYSL